MLLLVLILFKTITIFSIFSDILVNDLEKDIGDKYEKVQKKRLRLG